MEAWKPARSRRQPPHRRSLRQQSRARGSAMAPLRDRTARAPPCDLNLRIEGSELDPRVQQLQAELAARGRHPFVPTLPGRRNGFPGGRPGHRILLPRQSAPQVSRTPPNDESKAERPSVHDACSARMRTRRRSCLSVLAAQGLAAFFRQSRRRVHSETYSPPAQPRLRAASAQLVRPGASDEDLPKLLRSGSPRRSKNCACDTAAGRHSRNWNTWTR